MKPGNMIVTLMATTLMLPFTVAAKESQSTSEQTRQLPQKKLLTELGAEIAQVRRDYERRIQALEHRLAEAEANARNASNDAEEALTLAEDLADSPQTMPASALSDFNPGIGAVFIGTYNNIDSGGAGYAVPGFQLGPETGPPTNGISLGESELNFQSNVDDKFFANLTLAIADDDGETAVELEEAYIQTLALPAHMAITAGRFFSSVGYLNSFHSHADDFVDRPLPYQAFFGGQYLDDGLKMTWLAPTDFFLEFGGEVLKGQRFPVTGAANNGKGAWTLFTKAGGDIGLSTSWKAGASYLNADVDGRASDPAADEFEGTSDLWGLDFVVKWAPMGNPGVHNFKLQGEYFSREENGLFGITPYHGDQDGWYVQGIYQFMPGWRAGYRRDELNADNIAVSGSELDDQGFSPSRDSLIVEWNNSEFSRIRLQYTNDNSSLANRDWVSLQYIMNIGAHGAHQF